MDGWMDWKEGRKTLMDGWIYDGGKKKGRKKGVSICRIFANVANRLSKNANAYLPRNTDYYLTTIRQIFV